MYLYAYKLYNHYDWRLWMKIPFMKCQETIDIISQQRSLFTNNFVQLYELLRHKQYYKNQLTVKEWPPHVLVHVHV